MPSILTRPIRTLGQRIRAARKEAGLTQKQLADRLCHKSRAAIAQWELDATAPSISTLAQVGFILQVAPEWLAYGRVDPHGARPAQAA